MNLALLPLYAIVLPFLLWPIELYLPYPYLVEEIAKGLLIFFILKSEENFKRAIYLTFIMAVLFTISESVLYLFNIYYSRDLANFFLRLVLTGGLHAFTSMIILFSAAKKRSLIILGVTIAAIVHYLYNFLIPGI